MRLVRVESETTPAAPDRSNEIVLADDAVAVLHQVNQQVEDLRLDMYRGLGAPELASFDIDLIVTKAEGHAWAKHISRVSKGHVEIKSWLSESLDWPRSA